ncbi:unnamed protein product [Bursaphelenchus xylophilus]|uniref:(pine wood nematode) hypothetical protein n=1 Tax=Bursaphelenchus xylophilus TaxID=6326 RepID=A0A7I8XH31_BURXY|nr:unnamed protein product [Bursaphelenchus xylophilus]CAG9079699.1 unnamed protein product [Bursaphelenchus xylophilus]
MLNSPDEFPTENMLFYYNLSGKIMLPFKTCLIIPTLLVMTNASTKSMKLYHKYIVSTVLWSFASSVVWTSVGTIDLLPTPCFAFFGFGSSLTENEALFFGTAAFLTTGRLVAIAFQLLFRISQFLHPQSKLYKPSQFITTEHPVLSFFATLAAIYGIVWVPILVTFPDQPHQRQLIALLSLRLDRFLKRSPRMLCFAKVNGNGNGLLVISVIIIFLATVTPCTIYFIHRRAMQSRAPEKTLAMHQMLLKAFIAQIALLIKEQFQSRTNTITNNHELGHPWSTVVFIASYDWIMLQFATPFETTPFTDVQQAHPNLLVEGTKSDAASSFFPTLREALKYRRTVLSGVTFHQ